LPDWDTLAHELWREASKVAALMGERCHSPWRRLLKGKSPREVPQFLPMVFELAHEYLGEERFRKILRRKLYENAKFPTGHPKFRNSDETLAVLGRLIAQEHGRGRYRRIASIVTLNADDLLERATLAMVSGRRLGSRFWTWPVRPVARSTHSIVQGATSEPIRIYHIHGYLPSWKQDSLGGDFAYMLVFTDSQYWSTGAAAAAFANRVMLSALSESRCIFIGLSMTDINLLRWLALRTLERDRDASEFGLPEGRQSENDINRWFRRHFWIRPKSDDPTGFLSDFLKVRGINSVEIKAWRGPYFRRLIEQCFPKS
jgi:hypothetical protein